MHACACVCVCVWERERNLKTKGALLESHCMYSYCSRTRVILWDISGCGWAELKGWACSTERACVFLCERLVGRGRKTNSNLDGGREIHEVRVCDSDAHREMRYVCVWERSHNSFTYHYLVTMDVHRLNISQYLLRIVAKGTISIQRYKDWTLTYHIFSV